MSAHTPGPWRVWETGDSKWEICEPERPNRHSHFASVSVGNMWGDEGKANARLIAAAPDLLEALIGMVDSYEHEASMNNPALLTARAVIAKATGKLA